MPRIGLFVPAYRRNLRVETGFSMMFDINFVCELDKRAEVEKNRILREFVESVARGEVETVDGVMVEAKNALDDASRVDDATFEMVPTWRSSCFIDRNRNGAMKWAMDNDCDLLYMLDSDVFAPGGTHSILGSLFRTMAQTGAAVVGGVYMHRNGDKVNVKPARPNEIYEAEWLATGMMLIDMAATAKLPWPRFKVDLTDDGCDVKRGEDIYFCELVRENGLKLVADYTIANGHGSEGTCFTLPAEIERELKEKADAAA